MRELLAILAEWSARGQPAALATVVAVHGRAPLPVGSTLIVAADGGTAGAVSGGCVEQEVVRTAQYVLRGAPAERLRFAPGQDGLTGSGLPCGGGIDVWVQPWLAGPAGEARGKVDAGAAAERLRIAAEQARFAEAALSGRPAVLPFALDDGLGFELSVDPPARLVLVGAGLVAGALCSLARSLDLTPIVIDPRAAIAAHAPLEAADQLLLDWPEEAFAKLAPLGAADAVVVLSHQPALDDAALLAAVAGEAGFIGALGSRTAHRDRLARLRAAGMAPADVARIIGPVGLDLGGWTPAEVAVSIAGELIAARHGRAGGRLAARSGSIHGLRSARTLGRPA
jgi:xanthine dehydrogenase accessory factor